VGFFCLFIQENIEISKGILVTEKIHLEFSIKGNKGGKFYEF